MAAKKRFPVTFLGCAHPHAAGRANRLRVIEGVELVGAYDDDAKVAESFAATHRTRVLASPSEALSAARDGLVVIETWNWRAVELATLAVKAGVPLLLDKPGAHHAKALRQLRDLAADAKSFVQVGYHMRYGPTVAPAFDVVKSGRLGKITTGRFHAAVQKPWLKDPWFCDERDLGGLVFLDACHVFDLLFWFLGRPSEVVCRTKKLAELGEHPFEDSAALLVTIGDTLIAGDVCGWESNDWVDTWNLELYGTEGTLVVHPHPPRLKVWSPQEDARRGVARGWSEVHHENFNGEENYERELRDVVARVRKGDAPGGCTLDHAVAIVEAVELAYQSADGKMPRRR
jgi:predicted dehydrogenase